MLVKTSVRSRWISWQPGVNISGDARQNAPTEPSKRSSEGSVGAVPANSVEIETVAAASGPYERAIAQALSVIRRAGVRIMRIEGRIEIGIWTDLDGPEIRRALRILDDDCLPVRYLDGEGIPMPYKLRRVDGEPVTPEIREAMEREPDEPWAVRDRMLKEIGWHAKPKLWTDGPLRAHPAEIRPEQQDAR